MQNILTKTEVIFLICGMNISLALDWLKFAHKVALVKIDSFTYIKFNGTKKIRKF